MADEAGSSWPDGFVSQYFSGTLSFMGSFMKKYRNEPYCLIVEGNYATLEEARHALLDPFIEDWTERTGRFRIHQMDSIVVVPGVMLGHLDIEQTADNTF